MNVENLYVYNQGFKGLRVWQRAIALCKPTYQITQDFPKEEIYGLISQMRRCSISIAEGSKCNTKGEFAQFIGIDQGSLAELETQSIISNELGYIPNILLIKIDEELDAIGKMLLQLNRSLKTS